MHSATMLPDKLKENLAVLLGVKKIQKENFNNIFLIKGLGDKNVTDINTLSKLSLVKFPNLTRNKGKKLEVRLFK